MIESVEVESVADLIVKAASLVRSLKYHIWWRGHADASWDLVPSVLRPGRGHVYERNVVNQFQWRAPGYRRALPAKSARAEWLTLMQHYRVPTRLLDWSESPLVAAFFAVSGQSVGIREACIWALDPFSLNGAYYDKEVIFNDEAPEVAEILEIPFTKEPPAVPRVAATQGRYIDERMRAQLAAFTLHGSPGPLQAVEGAGKWLTAFSIPAKVQKTMREDLHLLGVRKAAMFPDLENLAAEVSSLQYFE